jgi:hypothetical protein
MQTIAPLIAADLLAPVQRMRYKLEIYDGAQAAAQADLKADYQALDLDTEAEIITAINATNAGFNTLLAKLRTHGIIDTA